jgi:hypothetical protein
LVAKEGELSRVKQFRARARARMNLGKEMAKEKRAMMVVYKKAVDMIADDVGKPYDPAEHKPFVKMTPKQQGR